MSLPRLPEEYVGLQQLYDEILATGASYVSAKSGSNRQSVQLVDMDADGENEVVSFFKNQDGTFSVYVHKKFDETYLEIGRADGVGKNIRTVDYVSMNAVGGQALLVTWDLEDSLQSALSVYTIGNGTAQNVLDLQYLSYYVVDMDMDAQDDIIAVYRESGEQVNSVAMYGFDGTECVLKGKTQLSIESDKVVNIVSGFTTSGKRAVYIDSSTPESEYVTDIIFCHSDGVLMNESIDTESGSANVTKRHINIYSTDIDSDGIVEIPLAKMFTGYTDPLSSDTRWKINWSEVETGKIVNNSMDTFHNSLEGWFFVLPSKWDSAVSAIITGETNVNQTTFFVPEINDNDEFEMVADADNSLITIYAINSDVYENFARKNKGIVIVKETETTVYGYKIYENSMTDYAITADEADFMLNFTKSTEWSSEGLVQ
ncbi:MAG: hypothetical protein IKU13_09030 [Clostridia bacterium]|nr:hypothetical protein [Clostridia bacterium]